MSATVKHIPSTSSSNLDAYLDREKEGNGLPRVLYEFGQHCRPETAAQEFRALREAHGQQGAVRKVAAKYKEPEDPAGATHLKIGKNWREATATETATHLRIAPEVPYVKRDEAHHFIYSFDLATVNPQDPEQTQGAFEAVVAFREEYTPGTQSKFVAHGDATGSKVAIQRGEGGKFHVHEAMNAVVHTGMEVDGRQYRKGQRVAGAITHVDTYRAAWDQFLKTRGQEFGLSPQDRSVLPEVGSPEYRAVRRTEQDFWARERGEISDHDRARSGIETAYARLAEDPAQLAGLDYAERIERLAAEASATGDVELKLRRTKADEVKIRSFVVPGRKQPIASTKLGERYANATATVGGAQEQLVYIAQGSWKPFARGEVGPPKQIERLPDAEVANLQCAADGLAREERQIQQAESEPPRRQPRPKTVATATEVLGPYKRDYGRELAEVRRTLVDEHLRQHPGTEPRVAAQMVDGQLYTHALDGSLKTDLEAVRADLAQHQKSAEQEHPRSDVRTSEAASDSQDKEPAADRDWQSERLREPAAPTPKRPTPPRNERRARSLSIEERRSAELIAVVRSERADGGAYVDFQLAAPGPGEHQRPGLHLLSAKTAVKQKDGTEREVTRTWTQLTAPQYDRLKLASGENRVETEGKTVYGLAADVEMPRQGGHAPNPNTFQSSRRKQIDQNILAEQRASEDRGRAAERAHRKARKSEPSAYEIVSQANKDRESGLSMSR
ncbi:hypothetical protein [Brevibacterium sp. RIT 803]|uniref:hypothetical protein n=1 Tax=Brevibacterium sp. RIT 803 TaxID=2810210 RepID=UPI00194FF65A|nr:hypothetical protein [Brevibacterium sp. RIT 803]MBM6588914.1 hypothetical protein [Brevibacterium sp. RIT 803]